MNTINKGIACRISVTGEDLTENTEYTACLYSNAKTEDGKITVTATAKDNVCAFVFSAEQTAQLRSGNVKLEIYDKDKTQMKYDEAFAVVRSTSLQS